MAGRMSLRRGRTDGSRIRACGQPQIGCCQRFSSVSAGFWLSSLESCGTRSRRTRHLSQNVFPCSEGLGGYQSAVWPAGRVGHLASSQGEPVSEVARVCQIRKLADSEVADVLSIGE